MNRLTILTNTGKITVQPKKNKIRLRSDSKKLLLKIMGPRTAVFTDETGPYMDVESKNEFSSVIKNLIDW